MEFIESSNVPPAIGPYTQAIKANGLIYTSAQVPMTENGEVVEKDIKIQTRKVLENLRLLLEDSQSSLDRVIKVNIYLANIEDFGVVNVLYSEAFGEHKPVRSTIAAKLPMGFLVQMEAIAQPYDYQ